MKQHPHPRLQNVMDDSGLQRWLEQFTLSSPQYYGIRAISDVYYKLECSEEALISTTSALKEQLVQSDYEWRDKYVKLLDKYLALAEKEVQY